MNGGVIPQQFSMPTFHGISARSRVDAFCIAAANSKLTEMRALVDDGVAIDGISSDGFTALASASRLGLIRSVDLLLEIGSNINLPSWEEMTPLMFACSEGKTKGSKIAIRLISEGANVKYVRKSDEMTALKFAAKRATPDVLQMLIDYGADVDGPSRTAQTALMIAARKNNVDNLRVLVQNGADVNRQCKLPWAENRTALGLAELEKQTKAVKYLRTVTGATG